MNFTEWKKAVDSIISAKIIFSSEDMPDLCFADMFEDEMTPEEAASYSFELWAEDGDMPLELI